MNKRTIISRRKQVKQISYEHKKSMAGFFFVLPWTCGVCIFFLLPMIQSLMYAFSKMDISSGSGYTLSFIGYTYFMKAFTTDAVFPMKLFISLSNMLYQVPIIVIFSLFIALIINQKFLGRVFVRATFFLPVIIANGVILSIINGDALSKTVMATASASQLFKNEVLNSLLLESGVSMQVINSVVGVVDSMFSLIWKSGIQILIFLAGLQTIQPSMYEVAKIEGATGWESFWKVTFPILSPMIILNLIFSMIDSFTDYMNPVMAYVNENLVGMKLEYGSALAWIYFVLVMIIILLVYMVVNKRVHYDVK